MAATHVIGRVPAVVQRLRGLDEPGGAEAQVPKEVELYDEMLRVGCWSNLG